eukprot:scaffold975_cov398-Prasinococcus_capsulatus_cf.AAC.5
MTKLAQERGNGASGDGHDGYRSGVGKYPGQPLHVSSTCHMSGWGPREPALKHGDGASAPVSGGLTEGAAITTIGGCDALAPSHSRPVVTAVRRFQRGKPRGQGGAAAAAAAERAGPANLCRPPRPAESCYMVGTGLRLEFQGYRRACTRFPMQLALRIPYIYGNGVRRLGYIPTLQTG